MARKAIAKKTTGTSVALVDQELANEVALLKNQISQPTGNKIKVEPRGSFSLPDGTDLGDEMQVVVVDFYNRNFFYSTPFDPNNIQPPDCYAMGKDKAEMAPEDDSPHQQHEKCITCPLNQFGSANNGKGKACSNRYYLAVLVVDPDNPDAHNEPDAPLYILDLSPTNLRSFEAAVQGVARTLNGPPIKAILTATAKNVGTYAAVSFSSPIPNQDYAQHVGRRAEAHDILTRRPDFTAAAMPPPKSRQPARRQAGARR